MRRAHSISRLILLVVPALLGLPACDSGDPGVVVPPFPDAPLEGQWDVAVTITSDECGLLSGVSGWGNAFTPLGDVLEVQEAGSGLTVRNAIYCANFCPWGTAAVIVDAVTYLSRRTALLDGTCVLEIEETDTGTRRGTSIAGDIQVSVTPVTGCASMAACAIRGTFLAERCAEGCGPVLECFRVCPE